VVPNASRAIWLVLQCANQAVGLVVEYQHSSTIHWNRLCAKTAIPIKNNIFRRNAENQKRRGKGDGLDWMLT
jgi:hypothetical protein